MTWINRVRRTMLLLAAAWIGFLAAGQAAPAIRSALIRFGHSPSLAGDSIATFNYTIENPDPSEVRVVLTLEPVGGGTVYSREIRIGPRAKVEDRVQMVTTRTESYEALLYLNGEIVSRDKVGFRLENTARLLLYLINDDSDFTGSSALVKNPRLQQNVYLTSVPGAQTPDSWIGFGEAAAVVVIRPDYHNMSTLQFQALIDFVHHGGTLVWIYPAGILEAAATPLRAILPVDPVRIRRVEDLSFIARWAGRPAATPDAYDLPDGLPLVEAMPRGPGLTTLALGELPVVRASRQGLGTSIFVAVNPCSSFIMEKDLLVPLWNHLISLFSRAPLGAARGGDQQLAAIQQQLSGFRIPRVTTIATLLGVYLLFFVLILVLGHYSRRQATAWLILASGGIILTLFIFHLAGRLSAIQVRQNVSSVTVAAWIPGNGLIGEKTASLLSKSDSRLTLTATQPLSLFYPIANRNSWGQTRREAWTSPLRILRDREKLSIENLNLPANKMRPLAMAFKHAATAGVDRPEPSGILVYGEQELRLEPPAIPANLRPVEHAYVVLGNGLFPIAVRNGTLVGGSLRHQAAVQLDTVAVEAMNFLKAAQLPVPALALISAKVLKQPAELSIAGGDFAENDYRITLLPLAQRAEGDTITVPGEAVTLEAAEIRSRMIFRGREWYESTLRIDDEFYILHALLPPSMATLGLKEVELEFDVSNPGGNVIIKPYLIEPIIGTVERSVRPPENKRAATRQTGSTFAFTGLDGASRLLDPRTGQLGILFIVRQKQALINALDVERVNRWKIQSLKIRVKGQRPSSLVDDF